jgi:hypothetical protein
MVVFAHTNSMAAISFAGALRLRTLPKGNAITLLRRDGLTKVMAARRSLIHVGSGFGVRPGWVSGVAGCILSPRGRVVKELTTLPGLSPLAGTVCCWFMLQWGED